MGDDALGTSLSERVRTLEEEQRVLMRLLEIVVHAPGDPRAAPGRHRGARKPRERPDWLKVIPGGMAACAPLILPGHCPVPAAAAVTARHVWASRRAQYAVSAVLLAVGMIGLTPAVAADGPDRDAAPPVCVLCAAGEGNAGPALPAPLPWRPMAPRLRTLVP